MRSTGKEILRHFAEEVSRRRAKPSRRTESDDEEEHRASVRFSRTAARIPRAALPDLPKLEHELREVIGRLHKEYPNIADAVRRGESQFKQPVKLPKLEGLPQDEMKLAQRYLDLREQVWCVRRKLFQERRNCLPKRLLPVLDRERDPKPGEIEEIADHMRRRLLESPLGMVFSYGAYTFIPTWAQWFLDLRSGNSGTGIDIHEFMGRANLPGFRPKEVLIAALWHFRKTHQISMPTGRSTPPRITEAELCRRFSIDRRKLRYIIERHNPAISPSK